MPETCPQVSTGEGSDAVLAAEGGGGSPTAGAPACARPPVRDTSVTCRVGTPTVGTVQYPGATKTLVSTDGDSRFTLHVEPGDFKGAEMIGMLGENGFSHAIFPGL